MPEQVARVGYRRNGKQQACEPCRKGKLACDHGSPFCGRCVRRKTTNKCIYHPAPMTTSRPPATLASTELTNTVSTTSEHANGHDLSLPVGGAMEAALNHDPVQVQQFHPMGIKDCASDITARQQHQLNTQNVFRMERISPSKSQKNWKSAVYQRSARYYGPTSFSAVFSEHQSKLSPELLDIGEDERKHPGSWLFGPPLLGRERPNTPGLRMTHIVKALINIPPWDTCEKLVNSFSSIHDSTLDPTMIRHCIAMLWSNFEAELAAPRENEKVDIIGHVLFKNEEKPLPPSPGDGMEWLRTFTGPNLRFEMLGILFCFFGKAFLALQDWDPLFSVPENEGRDRKQTAWRMKECADVCLNMCDAVETVNFLVTALTLNIKILESGCTGDESYKIRRLHGILVTSAVSSGLHRLPEYGSNKLTAASEYKRRLFSVLYCNDKIHSSLNGTPPLLSRRYCDVQPCLDLDVGAPFLPEDELLVAISRLDSNGWNTDGNMYHTTVLRAKLQLSTIREDILELALGVNIDVSGDRIHDLHHRCKCIFQAFPDQLQYYTSSKQPKETSSGKILYEQAYLMLQYLQNKFLLDRVAIIRGFANEQGLLETAMEILDISLMFWMKKDQLMGFSSGFDWIITYYGVPSAGVLCVELLKKVAGQSSIHFSRSDAIQKLTLFIGFLEWVRPTHGNFKLAGRLRNVIKRVLDHVLEPPQQMGQVGGAGEGVSGGGGGGGGDAVPFDPMLFPLDGMDDMAWLNTIDWTQGSWMDFN